MDDQATFSICVDSDDEDESIFLTQVVKEESQAVLNCSSIMTEDFDVDFSTEETSGEHSKDQFCRQLCEL